MTQEEKAKAYDKALKVLHKYDGANIMFSQSLKEEMFPEIGESEDERIRKKLISYFSAVKGFSTLEYNYGISNEDAVVWLEKQAKLVDEYEDRLDRCACESFNKGYKAAQAHQKEKQGEEKCVIDEGKSEIDYCFTKMMNGEKVSSTWSKEDDIMLRDILRCLPAKSRPEYNQRRADWLKSLKGRVQPKQE